jgi:16S rRNA A1518/A1519 N6-dimethyltransferase RsmA/KsgA/DIM1 with predicted DNA glycosylase/AP lyase activity
VADDDAMRRAGIDPKARAEDVEVAGFVALANVLAGDAAAT